jgi:hypothetical protein
MSNTRGSDPITPGITPGTNPGTTPFVVASEVSRRKSCHIRATTERERSAPARTDEHSSDALTSAIVQID